MSIKDWFKDRFKDPFGRKEETFQESVEELSECSRCGYEYPVSIMMFGEEGSFCRDCMPLHKKEKEEAEFKAKQREMLSKVKYYCHNCKFHFSRKSEFSINQCPNCGSDNFTPESKLM